MDQREGALWSDFLLYCMRVCAVGEQGCLLQRRVAGTIVLRSRVLCQPNKDISFFPDKIQRVALSASTDQMCLGC